MQAGGRLGQADFYHHIELSRSAGTGQAGGRLTLIIIKNFLKEQAECRLGAGWGQADLYHHKELSRSSGGQARGKASGQADLYYHIELSRSAD